MTVRFERLEAQLATGPWFAGGVVSRVDVAFDHALRDFNAPDRLID